jgi:hypothetical protein
MFRQSKRRRVKQGAADASKLAVRLAQDKKFRKRLGSTIEHGAAAGRRTRSNLGLTGAARRLRTDKTFLSELTSARDELQRAYRRLETKRRTHRLRNLALLAGLASLAAVPQVRERIASLVAGIRSDRTLEDLTREELYARAQEAEIPGRSEMSKEELVAALRAKS